ncbi:uncharacterized protein LOC129943298 [Eupeodes corollae]|uniref:uncharacterized protein LOC129943298 n=1 Tax=Eupeodes corollae TaxID=290404 RepID=UPI0024919F45|nr:uncharacterized protein LOC129943298 [Eupeodes corollae]
MNILLVMILWGQVTFAINNTMVAAEVGTGPGTVYMRAPNERGPTTWQSGLKCLQAIGSLFLSRISQRVKLNMIITHSENMTSPASQIQEQYLILKNRAVNPGSKNKLLGSYLMSVISDAQPLPTQKFLADYIVHTDAYVIIVDEVDQIYTLFEDYISRMQSWNPGAKFLILYNHIDDRNRSLDVADEIFNLLLHGFYVNTVSLLYAVNNTGYDYYILDNFKKESCRNVNSKKIATCEMGVIPNESAVRRAIHKQARRSSLKNCTFYMCAAIAAPFIENDCESGLEMRLINMIEQKIGFQLNVTCEHNKRGVRENGTWTDLLGRLNNRSCDFIIGGFYSDDEVREDFWSTDSYLYDSHTWFFAAAKVRPASTALYTIYEPQMWLYIELVFLITWFFWLTIGCILPEKEAHKSTSLTAINSWGVTLGASVHDRPECHTSRIFFIGLCLYGLNVTSIYTSKLIAVFADPGHEHQISTIEEVIHKGIPYGGPAESRDWFENPDDIEIYTGYNDSDNFIPRTHNLRAVMMGERVILANRMFMLRNRNLNRLYGFPANVFSSSVEIIAKRGFPFLRNFNELIRQLQDGGFFNKIDSEFRYRYTVLVKIRELRDDFQEPIMVLTIHHLEGAFVFLIFGTLLSCTAFAGEQINYRYFRPWLFKKFNWKIEIETGIDKHYHYQTRKHPHHHHHHHQHQPHRHHQHELRGKDRGVRKKREKEMALAMAAPAAASTRVETESRTRAIISAEMEQIRFTPLKRRKIRLD